MNNNLQVTVSNRAALYRLGSACALLLVLIIIIQGIISAMFPQPLDGSALDWFILFQKNKLIGLIDFELLMVLYTILSLPIVFSLYILHRHTHPFWSYVYAILSVVGVICFIISRPAFGMLHLSNAYAAATTDTQRTLLLAAGEANLALFHGSFFHSSYILGSLTGLLISLLMVKSDLFSKATPYVRIGSSIFDFGLYIPTIGIYISIFSVLFLFIWNIMIAHRLYQLAKDASRETSKELSSRLVIASDQAS